MKLLTLILGMSLICISGMNAPLEMNESIQKNPRVFIISENEMLFEELSKEYSKLMLEACNNDINKSSSEWVNMLLQMQKYSKLWGFDRLSGVKVWIKVFCDKRGRIKHIAYAVKPSSRTVDTELFSKFLERFIRVHRMKIRTSSNFSHYTSASFPVR
jgi:hypothetical protein